MQLKVWITTGEHWNVPGTVTKVCASKELADKEAADLVNIMLDDSDWKPQATASDWETFLPRLQDMHGAQYCWVDVTEHEVIV